MISKESFFVKFLQDQQGGTSILAIGFSIRGAVFSAYQFSELILGVDPWSYWIDKYNYDEIRVLMANFKGEPEPPIRELRWDPVFYKYQIPLQKIIIYCIQINKNYSL